MDFTTDKLKSLVKKWHSLVEAFADVKTTDGYYMRLFCIGFTKKQQNQVRKTSYAQSAQIRQIRKKMVEIMTQEASTSDFKELVNKFIAGSIGQDVTKATKGIYPMQVMCWLCCVCVCRVTLGASVFLAGETLVSCMPLLSAKGVGAFR